MDEYKQLRDSMNKAPNPQQPQVGAIAPMSHTHEAQQAAGLEQPHKDEPTHEDHHQGTDSRVTLGVCAFSS